MVLYMLSSITQGQYVYQLRVEILIATLEPIHVHNSLKDLHYIHLDQQMFSYL